MVMTSTIEQVLHVGLALVVTVTMAQNHTFPIQPRQAPVKDYKVDLLIVGDNRWMNWFSKWFADSKQTGNVEAKAREYLCLLIHQANTRYDSIKNLAYKISLQVVEIKLRDDVFKQSGDSIDASTGADVVKDWVTSNNLGGSYDHVQVITGYKLSGGTGGAEIQGRAFVKNMCNRAGLSSSLVHDSGGLGSSHHIAHELGHNFGSGHDGEPCCAACSPSQRYIMAPVRNSVDDSSNQYNPWYFSSCSIAAFDAYLKGLTNSDNCFLKTLSPQKDFAATSRAVPGQIYSADEQCQMMYGQRSIVCLGGSFGPLKDVCTKLNCLVDGGSCKVHYAADGTTCGSKKWCIQGACSDHAAAPAISTICPNGQSPKINGITCAEFVAQNPQTCYTANKELCCIACEARKTNSQDCLYGDKYGMCKKENCNARYTINNVPYEQICCKTCNDQVTNLNLPPVPSPTSGANRIRYLDEKGLPAKSEKICEDSRPDCNTKIWKDDQQQCYTETFAAQCCGTCSRLNTTIKECMYGDKKGTVCDKTKDPNVCSTQQLTCCKTCANSPPPSDSSLQLRHSLLLLVPVLLALTETIGQS